MTLVFDDELSPDPKINAALIGPPKTGKTAGAASAPGPILYVNADLPARMRYARRAYGDKLKVLTVTTEKQLDEVKLIAFEGEYATIVTDPIGELYRIVVREKSGGRVRPSLPQYGDTSAAIEDYCRSLCEAPVNAIFVCHDQRVEDEGTKTVEYLPWTGTSNPKLGRTLMGMVDIVGFTGRVELEDGGGEYVAQLVPGKGRPGGDGFNCLAHPKTGIRKVDLTEWIATIKEHENAAS